MNFVADENFPKRSAILLGEAGHDVLRITESQPAAEDPAELALATGMERVLLTFDRDFGELIFHKKHAPPPAVLYFRFDPAYPEEPFEILKAILTDFEILGNYTVITRHGVRQRPLR